MGKLGHLVTFCPFKVFPDVSLTFFATFTTNDHSWNSSFCFVVSPWIFYSLSDHSVSAEEGSSSSIYPLNAVILQCFFLDHLLPLPTLLRVISIIVLSLSNQNYADDSQTSIASTASFWAADYIRLYSPRTSNTTCSTYKTHLFFLGWFHLSPRCLI